MNTLFSSLVAANVDFLWAAVLAESLKRAGLKWVVISPGSSSTALALAFYEEKAFHTRVILDERVASFFALGLAKATKEPVVLICTSGTAAANYFPALIEARMSGTPLLLLTADRPPQMRYAGAEQSIDQQRLYAHMPLWYRELPLPKLDLFSFQALRDQSLYAYRKACSPVSGPVHLNVPFPYPVSLKPDASFLYTSLLNEVGNEAFFEQISQGNLVPYFGNQQSADTLFSELSTYPRLCITVGVGHGLANLKGMEAFHALAQGLGCPILVDALSPLRAQGRDFPQLIAHYDLILGSKQRAEALKPDAFLHIGRLPTSKVLRQWIKESQAPSICLDTQGEWQDPLFRGTRHFLMSIDSLAQVAMERPRRPLSNYTGEWKKLDYDCYEFLLESFTKEKDWLECKIPFVLSQCLPEKTPLFIGTSMPIRNCEAFMPVNDNSFLIFSNRGANGLDGLLATSLGIAEATQRPSVLLIGDLGYLHDHAALLLHQNGFQGSLTILCIDNGGGAIFRQLELSQEPKLPFEKLWLTPQVANLPALAKAHGVDVYCPKNWEALVPLLSQLPPKGIRFIYIQVKGDQELEKRKGLISDLHAVLNL